MEYAVSVAIDGRLLVFVEANSFEEAKTKALSSFRNFDFNTLDIVGIGAVNAENEDGDFIDY